jgi:hypothetical protein
MASNPESNWQSAFDDHPVLDRQTAIHRLGQPFIVGDDQRRSASAMHNAAQMRKHLVRRFRIKISGWFIRKQNPRGIRHGARDSNALLFTTRQSARPVGFPVLKTNHCQ